MGGLQLVLYVFAIYGILRFVMEILYTKIGKKQKRISYITLSSDEAEDVQEAVRELLYQAYWGQDKENNKILVLALHQDMDTQKILEVLQKQYPEIEVIQNTI